MHGPSSSGAWPVNEPGCGVSFVVFMMVFMAALFALVENDQRACPNPGD